MRPVLVIMAIFMMIASGNAFVYLLPFPWTACEEENVTLMEENISGQINVIPLGEVHIWEHNDSYTTSDTRTKEISISSTEVFFGDIGVLYTSDEKMIGVPCERVVAVDGLFQIYWSGKEPCSASKALIIFEGGNTTVKVIKV